MSTETPQNVLAFIDHAILDMALEQNFTPASPDAMKQFINDNWTALVTNAKHLMWSILEKDNDDIRDAMAKNIWNHHNVKGEVTQ